MSGVRLESITLGHNPFKLGLTSNAIFIPTERRPFMSEYVLDKEQEKRGTVQNGLSASALMSILSTADLETFEGLQPMSHGERPDFIKRIEPLWGKGSLYEERFIVIHLLQLSDEQQRKVINSQMKGNVFFDHLLSLGEVRKQLDDAYKKVAAGARNDLNVIDLQVAWRDLTRLELRPEPR